MNAIATAIYGTLAADATLTAQLATTTSIYHLQADDNSNYPLVVFAKMSGTEPNTEGHTIFDGTYQIRAFSDKRYKEAETINERVNTLLHNQPLSVTGYATLRLVRMDSIEMVETLPSGVMVFSAGSLYRVLLEKV